MSFVTDSRRTWSTTPSGGPAADPIEVICSDGRVAVSVAGELDGATTVRMKRSLHNAIDDGASQVVLDLAAVTCMDSRSLCVLVQVHARMVEIGGSLLIVGPTPPAVRLFEAAGLASYLIPEQCVPTRGNAFVDDPARTEIDHLGTESTSPRD
jgi:anti-anti-sigma factor